MNKIREFVSKNKNEYWFRPLLVILITLVFAFGISVYNDLKSDDKSVPQKSTYLVLDIIDGSKVHIVVLGMLALGMAHLQHSNELKLKETKAKKTEDKE